MAILNVSGLQINRFESRKNERGICFSLNEIPEARLLVDFYQRKGFSVVVSADPITKTLNLQINEEQKKTDKNGEQQKWVKRLK